MPTMTGDASPIPAVVVTRADTSTTEASSSSSSSMFARLRQAGFEGIPAPMFALAPVDPETLIRSFDAGAPYDRIIVTSPRAASVALAVLGAQRLKRSLCVVPGAGTAQPLREAGVDVVHPVEGGTSEHVLALPELAEDRVREAPVLILAAPGGRTLIARTLAQRGADVRVLPPYHRRPLDPPEALLEALAAERALVTLVSSPATLERLYDALPVDLRRRWLAGGFVVSSERLAKQARALGAADLVLAEGASDDAMLESLLTKTRRRPLRNP